MGLLDTTRTKSHWEIWRRQELSGGEGCKYSNLTEDGGDPEHSLVVHGNLQFHLLFASSNIHPNLHGHQVTL